MSSSALPPLTHTPPTLTLSTKPTSKTNKNKNTNISLLLLSNHLQEAKQIHALMIKSSQLSDTYSASRLAEFYAISDHGSLKYAEKILNSVQQPNTFIWNTLIRGNLKHQNPLNAILVYHQMLQNSVHPDHFTFTFLLKACTQLLPDALEIGKQLHCQIIKHGFQGRSYIRNKLIHFYSVCGAVADAYRVFDESTELDIVTWNTMLECYSDNRDSESLQQLFDKMPRRDVVSWNTMIAFYVQVGQFNEAISMFRLMQDGGEEPNRVTLVSILSAIANLGALGQGKWVHSYIKRHGIKLDDNLGSALINMYAKCGCLEGAVKAFEETNKSSVDTWNAVISGLWANGQSLKAVEIFSKMESAGIQPNAITFSCILNACSHGGLVQEGTRYFQKMIEIYGIEPDIAHYGCMVDLFGRVGMFDKAKESIRTMPMQPDAVMWKALLSAGRIHRNLEMGEEAGLRLIELVPDDHASYVLLSNIYAMATKWEKVHEVRKMMLERGVRKPPGCSSIELDGVVHEFVVGDTNHLRKKDIYSMLDEMGGRLKLAGYEPDTDEVLLDIEEEKVKQSSLAYHSEKLAVAFGFISTSPRTTIHIAKNLRICNDCHSAMKLLSKIYNRDIVIRDCIRFHHFKEGTCSCRDFW